VPIKNFYEKDGFLFNIEGRIRKFYKAVTAPTEVRSFENFIVTLCRVQFLPDE